MKLFQAESQCEGSPGHRDDRLAALTRVLDWAEGEAAALNALDAGICLQLARLALQARRGEG